MHAALHMQCAVIQRAALLLTHAISQRGFNFRLSSLSHGMLLSNWFAHVEYLQAHTTKQPAKC